MKNIILLLCLPFIAFITNAQTIEADKTVEKKVEFYGKITDLETGEDLIYANIVLNKDGIFTAKANTDFKGNYSIPAPPGTYEMRISYTGYPDRVITGVILKKGQNLKLDVQMEEGIYICAPIRYGYIIPLIQQDDTTTGTTITSRQIQDQTTKNINEIILLNTPGVSIINL